jgi:hypothetical protein
MIEVQVRTSCQDCLDFLKPQLNLARHLAKQPIAVIGSMRFVGTWIEATVFVCLIAKWHSGAFSTPWEYPL